MSNKNILMINLSFAESVTAAVCQCISITLFSCLIYGSTYSEAKFRLPALSSSMKLYLTTQIACSTSALTYQIYVIVKWLEGRVFISIEHLIYEAGHFVLGQLSPGTVRPPVISSPDSSSPIYKNGFQNVLKI